MTNHSIDSNEIRTLSMGEIENVSGGFLSPRPARGLGNFGFRFSFFGYGMQLNTVYGPLSAVMRAMNSAMMSASQRDTSRF